jgi:hypothetical protein
MARRDPVGIRLITRRGERLVNRAVRQTNISPDRPQDAEPRPFTDFADQANIVLLGDPGAGKTHMFREAAVAEQARFIKARAS